MARQDDDRGAASDSGPGTSALPVWGSPGEPTPEHGEAARVWLARHGVEALKPTRSLAIRIGVRRVGKPRLWRLAAAYLGLLALVLLTYPGLRSLGVLHGELSDSWAGFVVVMALQLERRARGTSPPR